MYSSRMSMCINSCLFRIEFYNLILPTACAGLSIGYQYTNPANKE